MTHQITLRLTHSTRFQLESLAERLEMTEAEVVSRAVERIYESMENDMTEEKTDLRDSRLVGANERGAT